MSITAVLPAAGVGKRFGGDTKKQFAEFKGHSVLFYSLKCLKDAYDFEEFIIGASKEDFEIVQKTAESLNLKYRIVEGGEERWQTVLNCLLEVRTPYVLIHDAVRPFVSKETTVSVINTGKEYGACICCVPVTDTLKKVTGDVVDFTAPRSDFVLSHTPQVFELEKLIIAVGNASKRSLEITDEAMAMELAGYTVKHVPSSQENIKITYASDVERVRCLMGKYHGNL